MGWFWADNQARPSAQRVQTSGQGCPVKHRDESTPGIVAAGGAAQEKAACPVMHDSGALNPLNNMPNLSAHRQAFQKLELPTERTVSSIPKGNTDAAGEGEFWEYPSPQQMYNAMVRKGKIDPYTGEEIPEDAVESMVYVHNYLNEGCWEEILDWERRYSEAAAAHPKLLQFMGKPSQLTPRARWYHLLGTLFPSKFSAELPFDRHDWTILRPDPAASDPEHPGYRKVRYVIDFYAGPDDENGLPTFNLDVRPGLDNVTNARDRFYRWVSPIWDEFFPNWKK
ncbi:ADR382Wp [Eremothecium gossypii ATCC 10895]|uniref:Holocytochrome c-type synthase n=1 Tax=Eremothecium gossypii (strain ATCC 10895 / CBS 109.51 / FGSC 9923 / NRRL Y-1056) TaxID=284811 RepID=Q758Z5_EREGS|nr:ADR382Wp [Eremothecium gossypii ATCC 10895]AAS52302.1 ADR382Wp [Eremothecium gossypii ATCC 10895]AEY96599.1 FADR382Wp [Eremothecium gossypii FDAG1]